MTRLFSAGAAALAAVAGFAGCSRATATASRTSVSLSEVNQRYETVVEPAAAALSAFVPQALDYVGGSPAGLDAGARRTATVLTGAAHGLGGIAAPEPIKGDISNVAEALGTVTGDLDSLAAATGSTVEPAVARLVADAGRESAADNLVRLALTEATSPTTTPLTTPIATNIPTTEPTTLPPSAPATTLPEQTTTVPEQTTTVPQTTTTRPRATTTVAPQTTTVPAPTTTVPPPTTTTTLAKKKPPPLL